MGNTDSPTTNPISEAESTSIKSKEKHAHFNERENHPESTSKTRNVTIDNFIEIIEGAVQEAATYEPNNKTLNTKENNFLSLKILLKYEIEKVWCGRRSLSG